MTESNYDEDGCDPDQEDYESDRAGHDLLGLSVAARRTGENLTGWVYMGSQVVFEYSDFAPRYPAGIEDFAAIVGRNFARRLRVVLEPTLDYNGNPYE